MRSTHIPREIRILTKLFQCHSKGPLLHSKRKKSVVSSKTQNDYNCFKRTNRRPVWRNWVQKNKQTKNTLRRCGVYFELLIKGTKHIIENEVTDRASVQVRFVPNLHFPVPRTRCRPPFPRFCKVPIRMHWLVHLLVVELTIYTLKKQSDNSSAGIILKPTQSILESLI